MSSRNPPGRENDPISPQEYRAATSRFPGFRLQVGKVAVTLLDAPERARYRYECTLEAVGDATADDWAYTIPGDTADLKEVSAWDPAGTLESLVSPAPAGGSELVLKFREVVQEGQTYSFCYQYTTSIKSIVKTGTLSQTVTYADWVIFNIPCDLLRVEVNLPGKSNLVGSVPATPASNGAVLYEIRSLRDRETFNFLVGYERRKLGATFYKWTASAIGSGFIGALIARALTP